MQRSINEVVDFPQASTKLLIIFRHLFHFPLCDQGLIWRLAVQYFGYSLDNRIKPRYEKLKDKAISPSLASMLACVDCDFDARYMSNHSPSRVPYKSRSKIGRSSD
jgi:hypothetical protein